MSWLTGMLAGTLCVEGNLSSARTLKAPLKGSPRYPPSFIPNKSSENKHTALLPIKARQQWWGGRPARPGHRSKTSENKIKPKKQRELTVFLAANQNLMLRRVAHERESGKGKHDTSTYAGGCRGNWTRLPLQQQKSWWGFKHYLLTKHPPIKSNKIHTYTDSKEEHAWVCLYTLGWKSGVSPVWASAGGNQERLHLEFHVVANKNICGQACSAYLSRFLFVPSGSPHRCLLDNITTHSQSFFLLFFFCIDFCIPSFWMLVKINIFWIPDWQFCS